MDMPFSGVSLKIDLEKFNNPAFAPTQDDLNDLKEWCEATLGTDFVFVGNFVNYSRLRADFLQYIQPYIQSGNLHTPIPQLNNPNLKNKTALECLVYLGCDRYLKTLALTNIDIQSKNNNMGLLQLAVSVGNLNTTEFLLQRGARPEEKNVFGESLLFHVLLVPVIKTQKMKDNKAAIFRLLLDRINPNLWALENELQNQGGENLLHYMAVNGFPGLLQDMMKKAPRLVSKACNYGKLPIHAAILNGCHEAVALLLTMKTQSQLDARKRNPLHYAVQHGNLSMLELCFTAYSDLIESQSIEGETPLIGAIRAGNAFAVRFLLGKGANPELPSDDKRRLRNARYYAKQSPVEEIQDLLAESTVQQCETNCMGS